MSFSPSRQRLLPRNGNRYGNQGHNGYCRQANNGNTEPADAQGEKIYGRYVCSGENVKKHRWALKAQMGTALPAEDGTHKMPVSAGSDCRAKTERLSGNRNRIALIQPAFSRTTSALSGHSAKKPTSLWWTRRKVDLYATVGGVADTRDA